MDDGRLPGFRRNHAVQRSLDALLLVGDVMVERHTWASLRVWKRLRLHFAGAARKNLDARFGFLELPPAGLAELGAALEKLQGALQRQIAGLHFLDDGFELLETRFEGERRGCVG